MTAPEALYLLVLGCSLSLMIYALESYWLVKKRGGRPVIPLILLISAALLSVAAEKGISLVAMGAIFYTHLKPRSALSNGGSDSFLFVLLFAISIASLVRSESALHGGLLFIAAVVSFSYWRAGWVKLKNSDWRTGRALTWSIQASCFEKPPPLFNRFPRVMSWWVMGFELSAPLIFVVPGYVYFFCAAGVIFHFANFITLGLNRFFWTWVATYPALIYGATHLRLF